MRKLLAVGALLAASTLTLCQPVMASTNVVVGIQVHHHHRYYHRYYHHYHYYYR
jgi:hypothetical protein